MLQSNPTNNTITMLSPMEYLQADIASNFGIKGTWQDRIDWFLQHQANIDNSNMIEQSKDPALYFAGVESYKTIQKGEPSGYPITHDASASGLQLLSILSGCQTSALHCNVSPTGRCEDAYTNVYQILSKSPRYKTKLGLLRSELKDAVMTALYGSVMQPTKIFEHPQFIEDFFVCMAETLPGAWELNQDILQLWNPNALSYKWIMPDNFHVDIPVIDAIDKPFTFVEERFIVRVKENRPVYSSRALGPNIVHSIDSLIAREMIMRCCGGYKSLIAENIKNTVHKNGNNMRMTTILWDLYLKSGFLSSRILKYIDKYSMDLVDPKVIRKFARSMPDNAFRMLTIHDAFRCLPNNATTMRLQYNQILFEIAESNLLPFITQQFDKRKLTYNKTLDNSSILNSDYAIN